MLSFYMAQGIFFVKRKKDSNRKKNTRIETRMHEKDIYVYSKHNKKLYTIYTLYITGYQ